MPDFRYTAIDKSQQSTSGEITAATVRDAIDALEGQGYDILSIGQKEPPGVQEQRPEVDKAGPLWRPFEKLLLHRPALVPALTAYREELAPSRLREDLAQVISILQQNDIRQAVDSFESYARHWTPLLSASAAQPSSDEVLSEYLRRVPGIQEDRRQRWMLLTYPFLLLLLAVVVIVVLSLMVIPTFSDIFNEFGLPLPSMTQLVITVAHVIQSGEVFYLVVGGVALLLAGWLLLRNLPTRIREWSGRWTLRRGKRLHFVGELEKYVADLLHAGLTPPESLRTAATAIDHPAIAASARHLADNLVSRDRGFSNSGRRLLTHTFTRAMQQDMNTRSRIHLLRELGHANMAQTASHLELKQGLIFGPLAILLVGAMVGFTVLALFLPLVRLVEGLSG